MTVEKTYKSIKKRRKAIKKLGDVVFQMKPNPRVSKPKKKCFSQVILQPIRVVESLSGERESDSKRLSRGGFRD